MNDQDELGRREHKPQPLSKQQPPRPAEGLSVDLNIGIENDKVVIEIVGLGEFRFTADEAMVIAKAIAGTAARLALAESL